MGYSAVITPEVVIRPILFPVVSTNHSAPSGPATMPWGRLAGVGMGWSKKANADPPPSQAIAVTTASAHLQDARGCLAPAVDVQRRRRDIARSLVVKPTEVAADTRPAAPSPETAIVPPKRPRQIGI